MDFIKELLRDNRFVHIPQNFIRKFEPIEVLDGIYLSIQASQFAYCKPRETLDNLALYTHWEIALMNDENFLNILETFPEFQNRLELEYYRNGPVYANVPTDLVNDLYLALKG